MPIEVVCSCGAKLRAPDAAAGKRLKCPKCAEFLTVPDPNELGYEVVDDEELPALPPPPAPVKPAVVARTTPVPVEEEEDEVLIPKRRPRRDPVEEDDDRPVRGKRKPLPAKKSKLPIILVAVIGGLMLLGGLGTVIAILMNVDDKQAKQSKQQKTVFDDQNNGNDITKPVMNPPGFPSINPNLTINPKPETPVKQEPIVPAPDFPLEPEPVYKDLPADFVDAVVKAGGQVSFIERKASGILGNHFQIEGSKRPDSAIPLVKFELFNKSELPDLKLPVCSVPFGIVLEGREATKHAETLKPLVEQTNLELLCIYDCENLDSTGLTVLAKAAKLRRLLLRRNKAEDAVFAEVVKAFPDVTEVDFVLANSVGSKTLDAVASVNGLKQLSLETQTELSDADVARLLPAKQLRTLYLDSKNLTAEAIKTLAKFDQLEKLNATVGGASLKSGYLQPLTRLTRLRYLNLSENSFGDVITDTDMNSLGKLPHLTTLVLFVKSTNITKSGWEALTGCRELRELYIWANEAIVGIADCRQVEVLYVSQLPKLNADQLEKVLSMPRLKILKVTSKNFGTPEMMTICKYNKLTELDISADKLRENALFQIGNLKNLTKLKISSDENQFSDLVLERIATIGSLVELSIPDSEKYKPSGLTKLTALKNLTKLRLPEKPDDAEWKKAIDELRRALPNCRFTVGYNILPLKVE